MTEVGNHGGSSYEETDSLALFIGHSVESSYCSPYDQKEALQVWIYTSLSLSLWSSSSVCSILVSFDRNCCSLWLFSYETFLGNQAEEISNIWWIVFQDTNTQLWSVTFFCQVDLAPTLALLFGIPIPKNNIGVLLPELFNSLTGEYLYLLSQMCYASSGRKSRGFMLVDFIASIGLSSSWMYKHMLFLLLYSQLHQNIVIVYKLQD